MLHSQLSLLKTTKNLVKDVTDSFGLYRYVAFKKIEQMLFMANISMLTFIAPCYRNWIIYMWWTDWVFFHQIFFQAALWDVRKCYPYEVKQPIVLGTCSPHKTASPCCLAFGVPCAITKFWIRCGVKCHYSCNGRVYRVVYWAWLS